VSKRNLVLAAVCGAAVVVPALAYGQGPPTTATFTAIDGDGDTHVWRSGESTTEATIAKGGTVTFDYPTGDSYHNVAFTGAKPTSCRQTAGPNVGPVPPLPAIPWGKGWAGTCDFDAPGDYPFACETHTAMTGTVHVVAPGEPSSMPTATPSPGATPGPGNPPGEGTPATQTTLDGAVALARAQKGARVRGTVKVMLAQSRLEVGVWARRSAVVGGESAKPLRVGRWINASTRAGKVSFAVAINAKAKSALRRHHRLSVTVSVALTPPGGHKLTHSAKSTLRAG
jgi:plastocyanin